MEKVTVTADALRQVLSALVGPPHLIRELVVVHDLGRNGLLTDPVNDPIGLLIREYRDAKAS